MNRYVWLIVGLLCIGAVSAASTAGDDLCVSKGFKYTVNTWIYDDGFLSINGSGVNVYGTSKKAYWNSTLMIDGVVYRSGNRTYTMDGGMNGTIPKTTLKNDIQSIGFCSNNLDVPEFGFIGAILALIAGIGIIIYKKD